MRSHVPIRCRLMKSDRYTWAFIPLTPKRLSLFTWKAQYVLEVPCSVKMEWDGTKLKSKISRESSFQLSSILYHFHIPGMRKVYMNVANSTQGVYRDYRTERLLSCWSIKALHAPCLSIYSNHSISTCPQCSSYSYVSSPVLIHNLSELTGDEPYSFLDLRDRLPTERRKFRECPFGYLISYRTKRGSKRSCWKFQEQVVMNVCAIVPFNWMQRHTLARGYIYCSLFLSGNHR